MTRFFPSFTLRRVLPLAGLALALPELGCGGTADAGEGLPLVTIAECQELGGAPLFDPEDGRPVEMSCPEGLEFVAQFEEEFFGADGGICCVSPEPAAER